MDQKPSFFGELIWVKVIFAALAVAAFVFGGYGPHLLILAFLLYLGGVLIADRRRAKAAGQETDGTSDSSP